MIGRSDNNLSDRGLDRELAQQIQTLRQRVDRLREGTEPAETTAQQLDEALQQLDVSLEELASAQSELSQQNDQLLDQARELEAERRRYRDLFEQAPDAYLVTDAHGVIQEANKAAETLLDRSRQYITGQSLLLFTLGEDRENLRQMLRQKMQQGRRVAGERVQVWKNSEEAIPCSIDVAPSYDGAGRVVGGRWIVRCVSREEEARQALARSEARFRMMTENSTDMISRHAPDGTYLYASPAARSIMGTSPDDLIGRSPFDSIHPDDLPMLRDLHHRLTTGQTDQETVVFRKRRHNGTYLWVESSIRALRGTRGQVQELQASTRDISDRKEAEHALKLIQAAIEQIDESVVVTESDFEPPGPRIVFVNPAFERMTGYAAEEVIGKSPRILQGPETDRQELNRLRRALERGETFFGEVTNYRKDGSPFILQWHLAPVRQIEGGPITHWVAIQRDVTDQREAEQQAREHEAEMAHVARLSTMGEMASGLAHELNQPLAAISNYVQGCKHRLDTLAAQAADGSDKSETTSTNHANDLAWFNQAVDQIGSQASRAGQIIRRLRSFVNKREPEREMIDLNAVLDDVLDLSRNDIHGSDVTLKQSLAEPLPTVPADRIQIEQVVLNLVRNAIEALRDNDAADRLLQISTAADSSTGGVHLAVTDNGPGMNDEQLNRLFEPFFTTKSHGMGVGLNISQSIIQSHEGRLWAERNEERGVTFHLTLPGSSREQNPQEPTQTPENSQTPETPETPADPHQSDTPT